MLSPQRVLVVGDDELQARETALVLRGAGYDVIHAGSCAAARRLKVAFEIGLFDVELADGDGVELAGSLLAEGHVRRVVFRSAIEAAATLRDARRLGPVLPAECANTELLDMVVHSCPPRSQIPPPPASLAVSKRFAAG